MPVSATTKKDTLRITFSPEGESHVPHRYEAEIVCFLQIVDTGLEITYSHHVFRSRESTIGPFSDEVIRRMPLTPSLIAILETGVFHEFWSTFTRTVRLSTTPLTVGKMSEA